MSMRFISEQLLKNEIQKLGSKLELSDSEKICYALCKKELEVIKAIQVSSIDLVGSLQEIKDRLGNQGIYFMEPLEYERMVEKARKYDLICKVVEG